MTTRNERAVYYEKFANYIEQLIKGEGRPRAVLRRSLSFEPGKYWHAVPYVEPFAAMSGEWGRSAAYLVAGLCAVSGVTPGSGSMGSAVRRLMTRTDSDSTETRFLALLDADEEQLPHRLRQMIVLMAGHDIAPDWATLLSHVTSWRSESRWVQVLWARDLYKELPKGKSNSGAVDSSNEASSDVSSDNN